jgi:hypothetical protein
MKSIKFLSRSFKMMNFNKNYFSESLKIPSKMRAIMQKQPGGFDTLYVGEAHLPV